jgi:hypothetical protein
MFTSSINVEGLQALLGGKDPVCGKELQPNTAASSINREGKTCTSPTLRTALDAAPDTALRRIRFTVSRGRYCQRNKT